MGKFLKSRWFPTGSWIAIALLSLCLILTIPRFLAPMSLPITERASTVATVVPQIVVNTPLSVDSERLWQHLTALPFERFEASDRLATRHYITQTLEDAGWIVRQQSFTRQDSGYEYTGINLIAEYPEVAHSHSLASGMADASLEISKRTILIGAHYDTVQGTSGADDNGTGVAALLELAQLLGPNTLAQGEEARELKLVFFDLEEAGLLGSEAFVADRQERQDIAGAIILEMLGYTCYRQGCQTYPPLPIEPPSEVGDFLAVVGDRNHPELVERFHSSQVSIPIYTLTIPTLGPLTPDLLRSDHVPFWRQGIGAVMVTDTANFRNPHYHQASDRPETLNPDFFTAATQSILDAITTQGKI